MAEPKTTKTKRRGATKRKRHTTAALKTANARTKLKARAAPYFARLDDGVTELGYVQRKNQPGKWKMRRDGKVRQLDAIADDYGYDANGASVLSFEQAAAKAKTAGNAPAVGVAMTVGDLADNYLAYLKREKSPSTHIDAVNRIKRYIREPYGALAVHALDYEDHGKVAGLKTWRDNLVDEYGMSKASANRVLTIFKALLNHGFNHHRKAVPSDTAWRGLKGYKDATKARKVYLTPAQCQRLINVTSGGFRRFVVGFLMTGARPPSELAKVRVRDFHPELGQLHIPEDTKTGARDVALDDEGRAFFADITAGMDPDALIFPKDDGGIWDKSHHHRHWQAAAKRARLPKGATMYCLRHTYASLRLAPVGHDGKRLMVTVTGLDGVAREIPQPGIGLEDLADNMGTSIKMIEKHYGHLLKANTQASLNATSLGLAIPASNVTAIR